MKGFPPTSLKPNYDTDRLMPALNVSRMIKKHNEIDLVRKAIEVSLLAHRAFMHHIIFMNSEAEDYGLFTDVCITQGATSQAYPLIVASGANVTILHYTTKTRRLRARVCYALTRYAGGNAIRAT